MKKAKKVIAKKAGKPSAKTIERVKADIIKLHDLNLDQAEEECSHCSKMDRVFNRISSLLESEGMETWEVFELAATLQRDAVDQLRKNLFDLAERCN